MEWIARIRLLIASLVWLVVASTEAAQPAADKAKVIYLPRDVQVIRDKRPSVANGDFLLSKGADVDCEGRTGTFFIEEGAKLGLVPGHNTVFIKKGGELKTEDAGILHIYYEKGAKIGKPRGDQHVLIECNSINFKPFQPFMLKGMVQDADGKALAGIRVHVYGFAEQHLDTAITDRNGAFRFRPAKTIAYVAADLAPAWCADFAIRRNTSLYSRRHTQPLRGWEAEVREGCWGQDATLTITHSGERRLLFRRLHKLIGHEEYVWSMAFSRDGCTLATAGQGSLVRVWDVRSGKERRVFDMDCRTVEVSLDPNGKILASRNDERFLRLWDVAKGKLLRELSIPRDAASCLAFAPDGKILAAGVGPFIRLWDVASGERRGVIRAHTDGVTSLVFRPAGRTLFSTGYRRYGDANASTVDADSIRAWDVATDRELRCYAGEARRMILSADGEWLIASDQPTPGEPFLGDLSATERYHVFVWQTNSGKQALKIESLADAVALTPDGKLLAVLSGDVLHFWELASGQEVLAVPVPDSDIWRAIFSPDSRTLAITRSSGSVCLWDVRPHHLYIPGARSRSDAEWEKLWVDLASDRAATAYRALWTLLREPPRAVTLLQAHLRPTPPRQLPLDKWIADLNNDDFAKRQAAAKSLRETGESAERALQKAQGGKPSLETRKRIDQLLEEISQRRPSSEELRSLRAIQLLEEIGSPEAHQLLESLAKGWDEARQTREAKATLKRLHAESRAAKGTD